ncbi:PLP-dependent aspartate aminotransferase family protein [Sulfobacillus sp. hq2]|uniref:trans-sulfuration enzyme family protein n=1 Tax=Sulfobacillus TaxID=28033 RepID=UPI000CD0F41E|nr:aminotransferase class I/II-fold pyridoxal phosphate-dependent enzyme [Sulfobacillus sp. hq2]POB09075.1 cystathionine gamma-lyase [Sulfobacillus sp. hq2]
MDIYSQAVQPILVPSPDNAVSPPIFQTAAYAFRDINEVDEVLSGQRPGYSYTRGGNPNTEALGQFVANLEGAEAGLVTSSGTAALLAGIMTLLPHPGCILVAREIYGGTVGLVRDILGPMGYRLQWVDTHNPETVRDALGQGAGLLIMESISNPLGRVCDLEHLITIAHEHHVPVMIDNTFATPFHATPLQWAADLVVHSLTKFIGGHSDLILGVVVGVHDTIQRASHIVDAAGFTPDPFASWLCLRGARTLALRMRQASTNALELAQALEQAQGVRRVYYSGLPSHPDHEVATRLLQRGFGSIVSISVDGGYEGVQTMIRHLDRVRLVPSLGDVATTISHPVVASHRELTSEEKEIVGIDESIVRISVGIESSSDIIDDFVQALSHSL